MTSGTGDTAPAETPGWGALFSDGRAGLTILLNTGICLHAIDIFVIATIMPTVVSDIGGHAFYTWTAMLYMVGSIVGAASDGPLRAALGRRNGYIAAAIVFLVGSLICGIAPDMTTLLGGRLVQGLGGGMVLARSMSMVSEYFTGGLRLRMLAMVTTTWSIASVIGPFIGGVFAEIDWWRGSFWIRLPIILPFIWFIWKMIPTEEVTGKLPRIPYRRLALLAVGVLAVGASGLTERLEIAVPLVAISALFVWGAFRLDRASSSRLFPKGTLSAWSRVGISYWAHLATSATVTIVSLFLPLILQALHGLSPLWVGWYNTIFSTGWTIGSIVVAGWSRRFQGAYMVIGMLIAAASIAPMAMWPKDMSLIWLAVFATTMGIGIGMANVFINDFTMANATSSEQSITASSIPAMRSLGIAFGAAIAGLLANAAGLKGGTDPAIVERAIFWVYSAGIVLSLIAAGVAFRMSRLPRPVATDSESGSAA